MGSKTKLNHSILHVKCAAVLAKRWQSAAHPCLQGVAERMELGVPGWNIRSQQYRARSGSPPTGTAHSADSPRTNEPLLVHIHRVSRSKTSKTNSKTASLCSARPL